MLDAMRSHQKSLKWILGIVALSMVGYLGYYFNSDTLGSRSGSATQDWAAEVGGDVISADELKIEVRNLEANYQQQLQGQFEALRKALRLPEVALNQIVNRRLMLRQADEMGLAVSPEELAAAIQGFPAFKNENGTFIGKEQYQALLNANGMTPASFEQDLRQSLLVQKWQGLVTAPIVVTDAEVEKSWRESAETATFRYVAIPSGRWAAPEPGEADARAWFDSHASTYRKNDGRTAQIVVVAAAAPDPAAITDAEVRKSYDDNQASFQRPEQRRARHIMIKPGSAGDDAADKAKADALMARLRGGADFAALAGENSADPQSASQGGDLGWFGRGQMAPEFDQAVFEGKVNDLLGPVKTTFGWHIIQVTEARPAGTMPFDEVKEILRNQLQSQKSRDALDRRAADLRAAAADPAKFEEAARAQGLNVTETGPLFPGMPVPGLGAQPQLSQLIFTTPVGQLSEAVNVTGGLAVVKVTGTVPADQMTFEQARTQVLADLKRERARDSASAEARTALAAAGGNLDSLAKSLALEVQTAGPIHRGEAIPGVPADPGVESAIFGGAAGGSPVVAVAPDSSVVVASITGKVAADPADFASRRESLRASMLARKQDAYLSAFIRQLREGVEIRSNDQLIQLLNG